jgi:uroporphyrinogen decarboxylase
MSEFRPARKKWWNTMARFLWKKYSRHGDPGEIWRLLPLTFDIHTFNFANAYGLDMGADMCLASYATPWRYATFFLKGGHIMIKDIYGVRRALGAGIYPDMVEPVIHSIREAKEYRFPDPNRDSFYNIFRRYRRNYPQASIAAEVWGPQDFTSTSMFGMEAYMLNLVDYPEEMQDFLRRWTDYHIEVARRSVAAGADIVFIEDDYGYDDKPLMSMRMWKEFTMPHLKRLVDASHEMGVPVCLHSCGFQMSFLDSYVGIGIDLIQSFQAKAGNDFAIGYGQYGDRLGFITGIDVQLGEFMNPDEFRKQIIDNYRIAGRKGRHILGTNHEIQPTMPDANVRVLFETVHEIQRGLHD